MADPGKKNSKSPVFSKSWSSKRSSLSPPVFRRSSHSLAPPGIWDVEYPKQQLKRSFSERGKPSRVFQQTSIKRSSGDSAARSLWSAENKEYLEVRFGLMLSHCSKLPPGPSISRTMSGIEQYKSPSASSEASSIFSNPECSSFSSGSCDDFSSCKDEPTAAPVEEEQKQEEEAEDKDVVFLDFALEQGHLVDNPRAVKRTNDHPAKRHYVDCSTLESPRSKLCSPSPPPISTEDDNSPVWATAAEETPSQLTRSLTSMNLQEDHRETQQRPSFSPGRFFTPKSPKIQETQHQGRIPQEPEVHCKSFFLRRPSSFMRRKRSKESPPIKPSDGYYTAQLHCVVRSNQCQSFTFVVDGSDELLMARTIPVSKTSQEDEDGKQIVCSFYSCKQRKLRASRSQTWKPAWPMIISSSTSSSCASASSSSSSFLEACKLESSEMTASMKLSRRRSNRGDEALELEFVLTAVDPQVDHAHSYSQQMMPDDNSRLSFSSWEAKKSPAALSISSSSTSQKRSWWSLVPGSPVLRRKTSKSLSTSPSRARRDEDEDVLKAIWKQMEAEESMRRAHAEKRLQELAAFVVSSEPLKSHQEWRPVSITAVLPTGEHGMPSKGITGPSPLIKRWRTGSCDCGGWDLGCALDVFRNDSDDAHSKFLEFSLQRPGKEDEHAFNLVGLSNGLFSVKFREPFSALQAFGSAVAILYRNYHNGGAPIKYQENSHQWSKVLGLPAAAYQYPMHLERL